MIDGPPERRALLSSTRSHALEKLENPHDVIGVVDEILETGEHGISANRRISEVRTVKHQNVSSEYSFRLEASEWRVEIKRHLGVRRDHRSLLGGRPHLVGFLAGEEFDEFSDPGHRYERRA